MSDGVKVALIIGAAIIIGVGIWIYFSPFQTCIRDQMSIGRTNSAATQICATAPAM